MSLLESLRDFLNAGGNVLWIILFVSISLWTLVAERFIFFRQAYPQLKEHWVAQWSNRNDRESANALYIRDCIISEAKIQMSKTLPVINMLVSLCPLLGLLGTVTGMIHVFDVMAVVGTSNARAMAAGVSQATIPTMAGMMIAIGGLYFSKRLEQRVSEETHHLTDLLKYH
ncbi:MAG: MotA/TolQ/ExbB proton channel family protein [Methylococcaceae bacterium]|jgi:biopolymer transport protein ExbB|uniref:MotA/TolQ/ExbB proton channel family protein n=1 Tax=Methylicorpusculum sp. TaxID=2713644 RepID=UPI002725C3A4|nr:MotA/TolQ/ExbB proton channel family protein [Methylicorpusculum sp.]MDO9162498.1 MotA/TolQ/ExbB proton channel family protein [Methylococcaceae bacterium]MDP2392998.1 MotA/TolQ/ExbB proton channel family protein [Methylococcaceae bacterium]MDP3020482.1 MotA/TolQ/ExbB proton channel family protein [Methylococcaceae bacterium]MDP3389845.1 MotA/TolQ/ExbB proton channel family protein [Methylococcaceae bacterium]MDP3932890.1 MotA/TolQ/ExbB proton channel family protein [Methylococcaceae bacter